MKRKNIIIMAGAVGLLAASFVVGGAVLSNGGGSTRVIAGQVTPPATVTSAPEQGVTPTTDGATGGTADNNGNTGSTDGGGSGGSNGNGGDSGGSGNSGNGNSGNSGNGNSGNGNGGQQPQPEPQPQPQPQPQPEPENPGPVLEPEPEEPGPAPEPAGPQLVALTSVVSVTPADQAIGVALTANVVVTFSKTMDKASAEAAFSMQPAVAGSFSWDATGKVMTFNPSVNFAYNTTPAWTVAKTAADLMGVQIKNAKSGSFSVLKTTKVFLKGQAAFDGTVFAPPVAAPLKVISAGTTFNVGTWQRGFISFDLSSLPDDLVKLESAELNVYQDAHTAGAYGPQTGSLMLQSVSYGTLDIGDWGKAMNQFCLPACANLQQVLSSSAADGWKNADVLGMVSLDWANRDARGDRSQFRLAFQNENNGEGPSITATFFSGQNMVKVPVLEVVYVHP